MVEARCAFLEQGRDDYHFELFGDLAQTSGRWPGNLLSEPKIPVVFDLAKIDGGKNLLEANDLGSVPQRRGSLILPCPHFLRDS